MEKDKSPSSHGHGLPPPASSPSSRYAPFASPSSSSFPLKPELSPSPSPSSSQQQSSNFGQDSGRFSHDISRMPDFPTRNVGHRRAHSEILSLPDDISFDSDLGVVGCGGDGPSLSDEADEDLFSMYMDMEKFSSSASSGSPMPEGSGAAPSTTPPSMPPVTGGGNSVSVSNNDRPRVRHQHSQSMDGSTLIKSELLTSGSEGPSQVETKKAISAAKLADLALVDPKRAKRIWANRQSAARSKERKMRYISELERKVQTLQTEATTLSAQLTMLQRDTTGLNAENSELKLRLQTMEQQVHLQDALNDALREEVQRLKLMTGQVIPNGAPLMNYGPSSYGASQQFYPQNHAMQSILAAHQLQQLHIHSQQQQQQQMHPSPIPHQHQHQQQPAELRSKTPMTLLNQSQRDSSSDDSKLANKE